MHIRTAGPKTLSKRSKSNGFTIIEILIVIAIIGVLAGIGYVSYNGVMRHNRNQAKSTQVAAISEALEKYHEENGEYPSCGQMAGPDSGDLLGIDQGLFIAPGAQEDDMNSFVDNCGDFSEDGYYDEFVYDGEGPCSLGPEDEEQPCYEYELEYYYEDDAEGEEEIIGEVSDEIMTPEEVGAYINCSDESQVGQDGYIPIPGSKTYGTKSFCVMKYEAKKDTNNNAVSKASSTPWVGLTQIEAKSIAKKACDGCHLITEAEWMTIASYVIEDNNNWIDYYGDKFLIYGVNAGWTFYTAEYAETTSGLERRYYVLPNKLPNDEQIKIIDFARNASEWTSGTIKPSDQPGLSSNAEHEFLTKIYKNEWGSPDFMAGGLSDISNINPIVTAAENKWNHEHNKIGFLRSNYNYTGPSQVDLGFVRGGSSKDIESGLFSLYFVESTEDNEPAETGGKQIGFRVAK